jgi:plastocyanin
MNISPKLWIAIGVTLSLALVVVAGGWLVISAYAQGPFQGRVWGVQHDNRAVLDLLKTTETNLLQARQAGTSWLDIAKASGVSEQALTDALLQPVNDMHAWMAQTWPQSNASQMTGWMHQQIEQDIRVAKFGTMTDMHVFGGRIMGGGMMGNWNGNYHFGGMMNGGMMNGMMGGSTVPNVNAAPVPSSSRIDREIPLTARDVQFEPGQIAVKRGETIKFTITNRDTFAHNAVSPDGKLTYTLLPANQTVSVGWTAPTQKGTYTVTCTFHPGMQFQIRVE